MRGSEPQVSAAAAFMLGAAIVAAIGIGVFYAVEAALEALN